MEHRGTKYTVVQTANPTGLRWTVELVPPLKDKTGTTLNRAAAVRRALAVINNLGAADANPKAARPPQLALPERDSSSITTDDGITPTGDVQGILRRLE